MKKHLLLTTLGLGILLCGLVFQALSLPLWLDTPMRSNPNDPKNPNYVQPTTPTPRPSSTPTFTTTLSWTTSPTPSITPSCTLTPTLTNTVNPLFTLTDTPTISPTFTITPTTTATPTPWPMAPLQDFWRVNCGGGAATDSLGYAWVADEYYSGGLQSGTLHSISGTADQALYQDERWGAVTYTFSVSQTSQVTLKFAETNWDAAGARVFNVSINGIQVLTNLDICGEVGKFAADDKVFNGIVPSGNQITITLGPASADNPVIDAIQIIPQTEVMPCVPLSTWRLNCGCNADYTDGNSNVWAMDSNTTGGTCGGTGDNIANTADPTLYQSERWGDFAYVFCVPAGTYQVTLKFSESFFTAAGQRVFDVSINGNPALTNFDIVSEALANKTAVDKVFYNVTPDAQGRIVIRLGPASVNSAVIDALEIVPYAGPAYTPTQVITPTPVVKPVWRVDCNGGADNVDGSGNTWLMDTGYTGGTGSGTGTAIGNCAGADQFLYQSERWGVCDYAFHVPPGTYTVTLKFAEIFAGNAAAGKRVFNVSINGSTVLTNFDIFVAAGNAGFTAVDRSFPGISPDGQGKITIHMGPASSDNPTLDAIQIL